MLDNKIIEQIEKIVGINFVVTEKELLKEYSCDMTENESHLPDAAVTPTTLSQIRELVKLANEYKIPLTPRAAGTNLGGLTIPVNGGITLDLRKMNKIIDVNPHEMYAIVEPGVSFGDMRKYLDENHPDLTIGYPLSPPETSILCNALLDGLVNLSLVHGTMGQWITGLEAVLPTGELIKTGSCALSKSWFSRSPLPDLSGLFINFQGTTGVVTKLAIELWPKPEFRKRMFILTYDIDTTFDLLLTFGRKRLFDDIGCLSWTTGKMLFGIEKPLYKDPNEPEFFIYVDFSADSRAELNLKFKTLKNLLKHYIKEDKAEYPIEVSELVKLNPSFGKFADFPTNLDFLTENSGGGLTWVGTYGPVSTWKNLLAEGSKIMVRHGFPPTHVNRPMKGSHFCIARFITIFNKKDANEIEKVKKLNLELLEVSLKHGFIPYKTPAWVIEKIKDKLDPEFVSLVRKIKNLLDPNGIMNPGRWSV